MVVFGERGCFRAKWLFSGKVLYSATVVVLGESGCIRAKVSLFGQMWLYSVKLVVFWAKWLYSAKYFSSGKCGCNRANMVVVG